MADQDAPKWPAFRRQTRQLRDIVELNREAERIAQDRLEVGPRDLEAMNHLLADGPLGPAEIGRRLGISSAAATVLVDRLVAAGHATRQPNPNDRRRLLVAPTPSSAARARSEVRPLISAIDATLDHFTPGEQEVIERYLAAVIAAYHQAASNTPAPDGE